MKTDAAFLAGVIEGDGCILIRKVMKYKGAVVWVVKVGITQRPRTQRLLEHLHERFGGTMYSYPPKEVQLIWEGFNVKPLLQAALPYLITKKAEAKLALEFVERMPGRFNRQPKAWMYQAYRTMRALKKKKGGA